LLSILLSLDFATLGTGPQSSDSPAERLGAMRAIADGVSVEDRSRGTGQKLERLTDPVYRFDDPARQYSDGTVWAWCRSGRPVALLTLSRDRSPDEGLRWIAELTSLAPGPIGAEVAGIGSWQPSVKGVITRKLPNAPPPADDATKRSRQMKDLVRQIRAYEYFKPRDQATRVRYELRVLPQQLHRYADTKDGLIDGGMFLISYGLNPELILLVEARREGSSEPAWYYSLARIAIAELHVEFEGKPLWSHPGGFSRGPRDIYWTFAKPINGN
jgi:hypothetical protein